MLIYRELLLSEEGNVAIKLLFSVSLETHVTSPHNMPAMLKWNQVVSPTEENISSPGLNCQLLHALQAWLFSCERFITHPGNLTSVCGSSKDTRGCFCFNMLNGTKNWQPTVWMRLCPNMVYLLRENISLYIEIRSNSYFLKWTLI